MNAFAYVRTQSVRRARRREGYDLVNHDGVECAMNHQGLRDGQHRIAMSNDQRLGLGDGEHQIGVDGGLR